MDVKEENTESDPVDDKLRFNLAQAAKSPIYADFDILRAAEAKDKFIEDSGSFLKTDLFCYVHGDKVINLIFPKPN